MAAEGLPSNLTESRKKFGLQFMDDEFDNEPEEVMVISPPPAPFRKELSREESDILARMEQVRSQMSRTISSVGLSLENHFKHIPPERVQPWSCFECPLSVPSILLRMSFV